MYFEHLFHYVINDNKFKSVSILVIFHTVHEKNTILDILVGAIIGL